MFYTMLKEGISFLGNLFFIVNYFFIGVIVFYERRNPAVSWAWLMVILLFPYVGFLFYLLFGFESRKHIVFAKKVKNDNEQYKNLLKSKNDNYAELFKNIDYKSDKEILDIAGSRSVNDMVYLNYVSGASILTKNNRVDLFHEGNSKFNKMMEDIENAENFIHMQYYIIRDDELGNKIIALLAKKASENVEVRLLVDGMGNLFNKKNFYRPLIEAGGKLAVFLPLKIVGFNFHINYRNHRKICVIDGKTGYVGGLNIGDEYLGKVKRYGYWRDTHMRAEGDSVKELEICFSMDWNFSSKDTLVMNDYYLPKIKKNIGSVNMQMVSSGPDTKWSSVQYGYTKMMSEADKSIYITTPYFVPDECVFETLRIAALSGIDVRIIIPANPDHFFVYDASISYMKDLIDAGVKCYQYKEGFIHSKLVLIDGYVASLGTANMDIRSFRLNFEVNAFIYDKEVTEKLTKQFMDDIEQCSSIDARFYQSRSLFMRFKEAVARLVSPLL